MVFQKQKLEFRQIKVNQDSSLTIWKTGAAFKERKNSTLQHKNNNNKTGINAKKTQYK